MEIFAALYAVVPKVAGVYDDFPLAKAELKDLTPEEIAQLVKYVQDKLDLPGTNERLEKMTREASVFFLIHSTTTGICASWQHKHAQYCHYIPQSSSQADERWPDLPVAAIRLG